MGGYKAPAAAAAPKEEDVEVVDTDEQIATAQYIKDLKKSRTNRQALRIDPAVSTPGGGTNQTGLGIY